MSPDELRLAYHATAGPGHHGTAGDGDIYFRQRPSKDQPWQPPVNLGSKINAPGHDVAPRLSNDERTLLFTSIRPGGQGIWDVWRARRSSRESPFGPAENFGSGLNSADADFHATFAADDRTLLFLRGSPDLNVCRLFMATPDAKGQYQTTALDFPIVGKLHNPWLSADGHTLWFAWNGPGSLGDMDLWEIRRVPKVKSESAAAGGSSISPATATKEAPFINSLGMKFVPVPGTNLLFCMHETRRQDYEVYASSTPNVEHSWRMQKRYDIPCGDQNDHPVVGVSWEHAQAFCRWLSAKEGRTYRLPTDEEWSIAVGIGHLEKRTQGTTPESLNGQEKTQFPWGSHFPPRTEDKAGNYADMTLHQALPERPFMTDYTDGFATTAPVMSFKPNKLGLFDMGGNVSEWVEDWFNEAKSERVMRGVNFEISEIGDLLSSRRHRQTPERLGYNCGFRCVLELPPSAAATSPSPIPQASSSSTATATKDAPFVNTLGMKFVPVPITGGPTDGKRVLFSIWPARAQDFDAFLQEQGQPRPKTGFEEGPTHPAIAINWFDAQAFCSWLTTRERAAAKISAQDVYRLPSDHEWSCALGIGARED